MHASKRPTFLDPRLTFKNGILITFSQSKEQFLDTGTLKTGYNHCKEDKNHDEKNAYRKNWCLTQMAR